MTIEDELRRMFAGQRHDNVPGAPAVAEIVRGARRRRVRQTALSGVGAVSAVAVVAVGSVAVLGQPRTPSDVPPVATGTDASLPVVDALEEFEGVRIGTSLAELADVPGVEVTEFTADEGRTDQCYGRWTSPSGTGYVSLLGTWGQIPTDEAELAANYQVTSIQPDGRAQTKAGIEPGDTVADLRAAYGDLLLFLDGESYKVEQTSVDGYLAVLHIKVEQTGNPDTEDDDVVTNFWVDGLENCSWGDGAPAPDATPLPHDPSLPVLDPGAPLGGVQIGMSLEELEAIPDVEITEFTVDEGRNDYCYGQYSTGESSGYISVRGSWGSLPEDPGELLAAYEVTTIVPSVAVRTPEGIAAGSTLADLQAAYGDRLLPSNVEPWDYRAEMRTADGWPSHTTFELDPGASADTVDDVVAIMTVDGIENCTNH